VLHVPQLENYIAPLLNAPHDLSTVCTDPCVGANLGANIAMCTGGGALYDSMDGPQLRVVRSMT
jgi:hypothetical protein